MVNMYRYIGIRCPQCAAFNACRELKAGERAPVVRALQWVEGTCAKCGGAFRVSVEDLVEVSEVPRLAHQGRHSEAD